MAHHVCKYIIFLVTSGFLEFSTQIPNLLAKLSSSIFSLRRSFLFPDFRSRVRFPMWPVSPPCIPVRPSVGNLLPHPAILVWHVACVTQRTGARWCSQKLENRMHGGTWPPSCSLVPWHHHVMSLDWPKAEWEMTQYRDIKPWDQPTCQLPENAGVTTLGHPEPAWLSDQDDCRDPPRQSGPNKQPHWPTESLQMIFLVSSFKQLNFGCI